MSTMGYRFTFFPKRQNFRIHLQIFENCLNISNVKENEYYILGALRVSFRENVGKISEYIFKILRIVSIFRMFRKTNAIFRERLGFLLGKMS